MAKLSVEQALLRADGHLRKGEHDSARDLYDAVLAAFPKNALAQQGLARLSAAKSEASAKHAPPEEQIGALIALYNQSRFQELVAQVEALVNDYPSSFVVWNILAAGQKALGRLAEAEKGFRKATELNPTYADAYNNIGVTLQEQGKLDEAISAYQRALEIQPANADAYNNMGNALKEQGKLDEAIAAYHRALEIKPLYAEAYNNMGVTLQEQGKFDAAIFAYQRALEITPAYAEAYNNMGNVLQQEGKFDEAVSAYQCALEITPAHADAYNNMGNALQEQGKLDEAIAAYHCALEIKPAYAEAYYNMGNALQEQGKLDEAISAYQRALEIKPAYADAYNNMGIRLQEQGKLDEAISAYHRALEINPAYAEAYNNMGNALQEQGKLDEAISAYERALEIKPAYADAYNNMGIRLQEQGKLNEAIAAYQRALEIKPAYAEAYNNMGNALQQEGKLDEAISAYERALEIKPAYAIAEAQMLHQQQHICDFTVGAKLHEASSRLGIETEAVPTFSALPWEDNPSRHLLRAKQWSREKYKQSPLPLPARPKMRPARLKIGYLSADFHRHAVMYLMAGMFEKHNREKFEIFAFSYGPNIIDDMRNRVSTACDSFINIEGKSTSEIIGLVKNKRIDIAIHLNGYTKNARTDIFKGRAAPIQVNYLGYPGSMGAEFIDYIIADPVVIPAKQRQFYSEKVICLPHSFQPNDNERSIADTNTTRIDVNLPEESFVFCCFNNNYKISSAEFDIWMRLLNKVDGSVLWLLRSNKWAERNLRKEAAARGVDPSRLVIAPMLPHYSEHLARHKHADLFIDTFNYNAHTTASDALWSGLPVVTKQGKQFAARVAASLLTAVGLPELITETEEQYEQLILELATDPKKLDLIKEKLAENRLKTPLFDTQRYTQNFERGLTQIYNLYLDGKEPADIVVRENDVYTEALDNRI